MHKFFKYASDEEREHAMKLLKYLNKRGGRIILQDIKTPDFQGEMTAVEAMTKALELEKQVNEVLNEWIIMDYHQKLELKYFQSLLDVHSIATSHNDVNMCDFIETEYLQEQVDAIKELGDHITNLERVGEGLGVYMFDKELAEHKH